MVSGSSSCTLQSSGESTRENLTDSWTWNLKPLSEQRLDCIKGLNHTRADII